MTIKIRHIPNIIFKYFVFSTKSIKCCCPSNRTVVVQFPKPQPPPKPKIARGIEFIRKEKKIYKNTSSKYLIHDNYYYTSFFIHIYH